MITLSPDLSPAPTLPDRQALARAQALHDAGLVRRFNGGDETAFAEIVTRYRARLVHIAFGLLRNQADAEEIAQDTFVRAHRALALFRGESSLSVWLHCIALNLARNRYWYFFRRNRHLTDSLDRSVTPESTSTFADLIASNAPDPAREATRSEFSAVVARCMTQLNSRQRGILELRNVQQKSYGAIALTLAINPGTVKSRVARARRNLRALLVKAYSTGRTRRPASPELWFETSRPAGRMSGPST
jgi:RNA polymerase sigma-70 factor (ECF subfamily)